MGSLLRCLWVPKLLRRQIIVWRLPLSDIYIDSRPQCKVSKYVILSIVHILDKNSQKCWNKSFMKSWPFSWFASFFAKVKSLLLNWCCRYKYNLANTDGQWRTSQVYPTFISPEWQRFFSNDPSKSAFVVIQSVRLPDGNGEKILWYTVMEFAPSSFTYTLPYMLFRTKGIQY